MTHIVQCIKLNKAAEGLAKPPMPGQLGQRIYDHVSAEAWKLWLAHQTILINEHRLSMIDPKHRAFLLQEMEKFFFGEGSEKPAAFVPKE